MRRTLFTVIAALLVAGCASHSSVSPQSAVVPNVPAPGVASKPDVPQPYPNSRFAFFADANSGAYTQAIGADDNVFFADPSANTIVGYNVTTAVATTIPVPTSYVANGNTYAMSGPNYLAYNSTTGNLAFTFQSGNPTIGVMNTASDAFTFYPVPTAPSGGLAYTAADTIIFPDTSVDLDTLDPTTGNLAPQIILQNATSASCVAAVLKPKYNTTYYVMTQASGSTASAVNIIQGTKQTQITIPGTNPQATSIFATVTGHAVFAASDPTGPIPLFVIDMTPSGTFSQYAASNIVVGPGCSSTMLGPNDTLWMPGLPNTIQLYHSSAFLTFAMGPSASFSSMAALAVGQDDNIFFAGPSGTYLSNPSVGVFLNDKIYVTPAKPSVPVNQTNTIFVFEKYYRGNFWISSNNTNILTTGVIDKNHLTITGVSPGSTTVVISCGYNTVVVPVTVTPFVAGK